MNDPPGLRLGKTTTAEEGNAQKLVTTPVGTVKEPRGELHLIVKASTISLNEYSSSFVKSPRTLRLDKSEK